MKGSLIIIPATKNENTHSDLNENRKKRVAAYVRVSTTKDQQFKSFKNQIDYFQKFIEGHEDWCLVGIYHDEGVTGTNTKKRDGFQRMISDAMDGKIDLIVTKSITRFARNSIDAIYYIRLLKEKGVDIYFQNDNIWTLSEKGEFVITLISALAQEESRSISENTKWGMRKNMMQGRGCVNFSRLLGYDRGENGEYVINESQAEIVRTIYDLFIQGYTLYDIKDILEEKNIKTVTGKDTWTRLGIKTILCNERYKGDILMQKYYTCSFISHTMKKNKGELPQYYIKNHHEAIIEEEKWDLVQSKIKRIKPYARTRVCERFFKGIIYCTACHEKCRNLYGPKTSHSNNKYRSIFYVCNNRYMKKCVAPIIKESELILIIYDVFEEFVTQILESGINTSNLITITEGKVEYYSIILVYEMIDDILVLPNNKLKILMINGIERVIDLERYKTDSRKNNAYAYIKGTLKINI